MDFVILTVLSLTCLWLVMNHYERRVSDLTAQLDALRSDYDEPLRRSIARHPSNVRPFR